MATTDGAVLIPGVGHIFTHPTTGNTWTLANLTAYASAGTIPTGWGELGHSDLDSILTFAQDGGDSTVKGSWQNPSLRETVAPITESFTIPAEQVLDDDILTLYYGGGDNTVTGRFAAPDSPAPVQRSAIVVMLDGTTPVGFSVACASIGRSDVISMAQDDFIKLPLKFTILKMAGKPRFEWINADLGTGGA